MPERLRVQTVDGAWETLGVDRYPGVMPQDIAPSWNPKGPDALSFTMQRSPIFRHPDLDPFTPIEYMPDGRDTPTWSGFTVEAPAAPGALSVQARGWQYHGDDDVVRRLYVHEDLRAWIDVRQRPEATLSRIGTAAGTVQVGDAGIVIGWPKGVTVGGGAPVVGVMLDCGDDPAFWPAAVSIDFNKNTYTALAANWRFNIRNNNSPDIAVNSVDYEDAYTQDNAVANGDYRNQDATFTTKRRYVAILFYYFGGGGVTGEDDLYKVTGIRLFGKSAYRVNGQSVLLASDVLLDLFGMPATTPLLSTDRSLVASTALPLRHLTLTDETPMAAADRVNAYHNYRLKVDHFRRLIFQPQSDRAILAVDLSKAGAEFQDASLHSGQAIYNKVIVRGRSGSGADLRAVRYSGDVFTSRGLPLTSPAPLNPGFEVDVANWAGGPGLTRVTTAGYPHSGAAAGQVTGLNNNIPPGPSSFAEIQASIGSGTFKAGKTYRFDLWLYELGPNPTALEIQTSGRVWTYYRLRAGVLSGTDYGDTTIKKVLANGSQTMVSVTWTPTADTAGTSVKFGISGYRLQENGTGWPWNGLGFDDLGISLVTATAPDRRGFKRTYILDIPEPTDTDAMRALGDAFLAQHGYTPLRGALTITSDDAVSMIAGKGANFGTREAQGEAYVPLGDLGVYTGELILLRNLTDPDVGDFGRAGIINTVSKQGDAVTIALDNDRQNFQALLSRIGGTGSRR